MDDLRVPYLAGFIDGEGSIAVGVNRNPKGERRWYLRLSAHQTNPAPLFILKEVFGGSVHLQRRPDRKTIYEWVVSSMEAYEAIKALRPYLIVKAEEADAGVEFQELLLARGTRRTALTEDEQAAREAIYRRLRDLKQVAFEDAIEPKVRRIAKPKPPKKVRQKVAEPVRSTGYSRKKKPLSGVLSETYRNLGLAETARHFGVSRQTIVNWLRANDIPLMGRTPDSEGRRLSRVAATWRSPMDEQERKKVDVDAGGVQKGNEVSSDIDTAKEAVEGENDKTTFTEVSRDRGKTVTPDKVG